MGFAWRTARGTFRPSGRGSRGVLDARTAGVMVWRPYPARPLAPSVEAGAVMGTARQFFIPLGVDGVSRRLPADGPRPGTRPRS